MLIYFHSNLSNEYGQDVLSVLCLTLSLPTFAFHKELVHGIKRIIGKKGVFLMNKISKGHIMATQINLL